MKRIFGLLAGISLFLVGCNGPSFDGEWKLTKEEGSCFEGFTFLKGNHVTALHGNGENSSGMYKQIEGDEYQIDLKFVAFTFTIKQLSEDKLLIKGGEKSHSVCEYKKVK